MQAEGEHSAIRMRDEASDRALRGRDITAEVGVTLSHAPRPPHLPVQRPLRLAPHLNPPPRHPQALLQLLEEEVRS